MKLLISKDYKNIQFFKEEDDDDDEE